MDAGQGRRALHLHRRPRPVRRTRARHRARAGQAVRRRGRPPRRLPPRAGARGADGAAMRRLPHLHRRQDVLQHHATRAGGDRHAARAGDARRRGRHLGRRQHVQGQRHRALLPLRAARESGAAHLQAVARPGVRERARRPRRDERVPPRQRAPVPRSDREGVLDRRQHLGRDARGQGARRAVHERRDRDPDHGCRRVGPGGGDRHRGRHASRSPTGGRSPSTDASSPTRWRSSPRSTRSGAGTASA